MAGYLAAGPPPSARAHGDAPFEQELVNGAVGAPGGDRDGPDARTIGVAPREVCRDASALAGISEPFLHSSLHSPVSDMQASDLHV